MTWPHKKDQRRRRGECDADANPTMYFQSHTISHLTTQTSIIISVSTADEHDITKRECVRVGRLESLARQIQDLEKVTNSRSRAHQLRPVMSFNWNATIHNYKKCKIAIKIELGKRYPGPNRANDDHHRTQLFHPSASFSFSLNSTLMTQNRVRIYWNRNGTGKKEFTFTHK